MAKKGSQKKKPEAEPIDDRAVAVLKVLDFVPGYGDPGLSQKPCLKVINDIIQQHGAVPPLDELHAALLTKGTHWAELLAPKVADLLKAQRDEKKEAKLNNITG